MTRHAPLASVALLLAAALPGQAGAHSPGHITLAVAEYEPYAGNELPDQGYAAEVVTTVLTRAGYTVTLEFYPLPRAARLARSGAVDGWFPAHIDTDPSANLAFSAPFPGDNIGFLRLKSSSVSEPAGLSPEARIRHLRDLRFGMIRGATVSAAFDQADFLYKEPVADVLQNLDKLSSERIDIAVTDKYTAADAMVLHRPHMIGRFEFMEPPIASNGFHVAFSTQTPGHARRLADFNTGLTALADSGELDRIRTRHGLGAPARDDPDRTHLTIGTVNNGDMAIMQALASEFEAQHPHIALEWHVLDENTLRKRLLSDLAISAGQFDIMTIGAYEAPIWAERGWITPLEAIPEAYGIDDILKTVRDALSHEGRLYALPFYAESSMTYYRTDLFERHGLTMPAQPTYDDIERFAAAIHDPEGGTYGICLRGKPGWGENMAFIGTLVNTMGGRWFDMSWRPQLDTSPWREAITLYLRLLQNHGPPQAEHNGYNENLALFAQGRCGIWIDATVAAGTLYNPKLSAVSDRLGFAPAPVGVTPKGANWLWTWALAVPSGSKHKPEAMQFIHWATSREYIALVGEREGWVSVPSGTRRSTYADSRYQNAAPFAGFVLEAIESADPVDSTAEPKPYTGIQLVGIIEFQSIGHQVGQEISHLLRGTSTDIEGVLTTLQRAVTKQMQASGYLD